MTGPGIHSGVEYRTRDCAVLAGSTSHCATISARIAWSEAEVVRLAKLANRGPKFFARYRDELAEAKIHRAEQYAARDAHMAECPAAADRFGASA